MAMGSREARLARFLLMLGGIVITIASIVIFIAGILSLGDLVNH
jgi:hypothetical protein